MVRALSGVFRVRRDPKGSPSPAPCPSQQPKLTHMTKSESSQPEGLSLTKGGVESTSSFGAEVSFLSSTNEQEI